MKFKFWKKSVLNIISNEHDEINYTEDMRIKNAGEKLFDRMGSDDQYDVAKKHALKRELFDDE